ncbi:MAG: discoidin domain-containing protein [Rhodomicrobium sp.]|nr:discoidin domain-containing protein [Rhodomicrobium sp.]
MGQRFFLFFTVVLFVLAGAAPGRSAEAVAIRIQAAGQPAAKVVPSEALGAGLDGYQKDDTSRIYAPASVQAIASIPFYRLSYRLRTELGAQVWHWNPEGTWSDPERAQGYWVSSGKSEKPILLSNGYRLPRRGNTEDQANNDGYSRLSDGDEASFWKSNPYLDGHFTGEDNATNPQWVLINFRNASDIQGLRILWGEPFATDYEVQFWDGDPAEYYKDMLKGRWRAFPKGVVKGGTDGDTLLRLSDRPVRTPYVRIVLKKGSGTAPAGSTDIRDRLGFAIREIHAGGLGAKGELIDRMVHAANNKTQTEIVTSSTDPWHRASDLDENVEQPGIDLVMQSGLTRGRPVMMPTGLLYDTPENAAAQIRFLKARGYDIRQIELGEEPDGQYVFPEHYGALFIQFTDAIRRENPSLVMGGPGFQSEVDGWNSIPDDAGRTSWMNRFLSYLKHRNRSSDFGFFSFEWYPFDDLCTEEPSKQLVRHPALIRDTLQRLEEDGVPKDIPWIITEYGYSSFAGQREVELPAALLNAEIVAQYLMNGIATAYLYGIEPNTPIKELDACETFGNLMALQTGPDGAVRWRLPPYYGGKLVAEEWLGAPEGVHMLYPAQAAGAGGSDASVAAYAAHRPDGQWALLILNKDDSRERTASVSFDDGKSGSAWRGPHDVFQYSPSQYKWKPNKDEGYPEISEPPVKTQTSSQEPLSLRLPPMSITIVRGTRGDRLASSAGGEENGVAKAGAVSAQD